MQLTNWLEQLNNEQQQAVTAPLKNSLILAGAGSGKTRVLVNRIAWLVENNHLHLSQIMAVTFTNKAATEMKQRLRKLLANVPFDIWVGTFHGLAHRLLRKHHALVGLSANFQILDSDDQSRLVKRIITDLKLDIEQWPVKKAVTWINQQKDEGLRPAKVSVPAYGPMRIWLQIYQAYHEACLRSDVVDFAELLLRCVELFQQHPQILEAYQNTFNLLVVDEFQDTNCIQYHWMKLLAGQHTAVMAVGDDDQSIYGWRGARVENIARFTQDFKDVAVVRLEQNYRSTNTILQAANSLIANNHERMGKSLWTEGGYGEKISLYSAFNDLEEAMFVRDQIQAELDKRPANDLAILYRSNAQSRVLEEALLRAGISYKIHGGMRFFERAEIKDSLAYLRLFLNTHDDAAFERAVHVPSRGVGEKTLSHLRTVAMQQNCSLWSAVQIALQEEHLTPRATNALEKFCHLFNSWQVYIGQLSLSSFVMTVLEESGLLLHYSEKAKERSESKRDNLLELVNAVEEFSRNNPDSDNLLSFLTQVTLDAGEGQSESYEDHVHLMTLHAAKGLEFPIVFMVGMEEGLFPSPMSINEPGRLEEERRLCYVGMTRAMEKLFLTYAEQRRQYGTEKYHRPSRFIAELPNDLIYAIRPKTSKNFQPAATVTSLQPETPFQIGQNVHHAHFGSGKVLAFEGGEKNVRVQVRFNQHGPKWLVLAYAKLQAID